MQRYLRRDIEFSFDKAVRRLINLCFNNNKRSVDVRMYRFYGRKERGNSASSMARMPERASSFCSLLPCSWPLDKTNKPTHIQFKHSIEIIVFFINTINIIQVVLYRGGYGCRQRSSHLDEPLLQDEHYLIRAECDGTVTTG